LQGKTPFEKYKSLEQYAFSQEDIAAACNEDKELIAT